MKPSESEILEGEILNDAEEKFGANERRVRRGFWQTLAKAAGKVPFVDELVAAYYCALDPQTPFRVRALLLAALAYFVLPLDAIPDFLLGFGFTDDVALLWAALNGLRSNIRPQHREAARRKLDELSETTEV